MQLETEAMDEGLDRSDLNLIGDRYPRQPDETEISAVPKLTIIDVEEQNKYKSSFYRPTCIPILITLVILLVVFLPRFENSIGTNPRELWEAARKTKLQLAECNKMCKSVLESNRPLYKLIK
jgi:hypothetical protein